MTYPAPLKIKDYDPLAGKEAIFILVGAKLGMLEYESIETGYTKLVTFEEALRRAI